MAKRDKLLDSLKLRYDYYSAQSLHKDIVSTLGLEGELDAAAIARVVAYLAEKVPGSEKVIAVLEASAAPAAAEPAPEPAAEPAAEPAPEAAPAEEAPAEESPAEDAGDDKKAKKGKKK